MITGSAGSAGLGFTRCLNKSPEKMFLVGTDCNERFIHFSETDEKVLIPKADSPDYFNTLNNLIEKFNIEFLHAQPDSEITMISNNREKIEANIFLPSKRTIDICQDKFESNKIWKKHDVPTANTIFINNEDDLEKAFNELGQPMWVRAYKGAGGKGSLLINKHEHARAWVDFWKGWGNFTASEYLPGSNFGWDSIFKDGELITSQTKERLEYVLPRASPSGITGTTGVARSIEREDINDIAKRAVYAIDSNPSGAFSVDMKGSEDGTPYVTEINPGRFLSSSVHFFYKAESLMPYLFIKLAYDEKINPDDIPKKIKQGVILVRTLDKEPILMNEESFKEMLAKREKFNHVIL